jgi:hypothetical protein
MLLSSMPVSGTATRMDHNHSSSATHTHTALPAAITATAGSWDTVAISDGDAIEYTTTVTL